LQMWVVAVVELTQHFIQEDSLDLLPLPLVALDQANEVVNINIPAVNWFAIVSLSFSIGCAESLAVA